MDQVLIYHEGLARSVLVPEAAVEAWTEPGSGWSVVEHPERRRADRFVPVNAPVAADEAEPNTAEQPPADTAGDAQ